VLFLTVPPNSVCAVLREITHELKDTEVISFAAGVKAADMQISAGQVVIRAMSLPGFDFLAMTAPPTRELEDFMARLTSNKLQILSEEELNKFTLGLTLVHTLHVFSQTITAENRGSWLEKHTDYLQDQEVFNQEIIENMTSAPVDARGDHEAAMEEQATPGGLTEAILDELKNNSAIQPEDLFKAGLDRLELLSKQAVK
jgi:hypothetical protein